MAKTWKKFWEEVKKMTPEQKKRLADEIRANVEKRLEDHLKTLKM